MDSEVGSIASACFASAASPDGSITPEVDAVLKQGVMAFARAKMQGELELGVERKEAAAGHYEEALSHLEALVSRLPADKASGIEAQLAAIRAKMKDELGLEPRAAPADPGADKSATPAPPAPGEQSGVDERGPELVPDEGLAELWKANSNGGTLGDTLTTGSSVFVLREAPRETTDPRAVHFEARGGALAAVALVTFLDDGADICYEDGAEEEGVAFRRVAARTESFEPSPGSSSAAAASHRRRAALAVAKGNVSLACGELVEALRWLELGGDDAATAQDRATVWVTLGRLHLNAGRADAALNAADTAEKLSSSVGGTLLKARVACKRGQTDAARKGVAVACQSGASGSEVNAVLKEIEERETADRQLYLQVASLAQQANASQKRGSNTADAPKDASKSDGAQQQRRGKKKGKDNKNKA